MKRSVSVNIGGMAFILDEDAHDVLRDYLDDVASRLPAAERTEVLGDVESRLAEILGERLSVPGQVVDLNSVLRAMATIGGAESFGERRSTRDYGAREEFAAVRKLYRSRRDRTLGGVCAGIADYFDWDPTLVRVAMVILAFVTISIAFWAYIVLWIVIPERPDEFNYSKNRRG